jgi:hypothetical protein
VVAALPIARDLGPSAEELWPGESPPALLRSVGSADWGLFPVEGGFGLRFSKL